MSLLMPVYMPPNSVPSFFMGVWLRAVHLRLFARAVRFSCVRFGGHCLGVREAAFGWSPTQGPALPGWLWVEPTNFGSGPEPPVDSMAATQDFVKWYGKTRD